MADFKKPSETDLRSRLTAEQYHVTQEEGTEPPEQGQGHLGDSLYGQEHLGDDLPLERPPEYAPASELTSSPRSITRLARVDCN